MATENYISQPTNVGVTRGLLIAEREHVICLLRVIEHLPDLSTLKEADCETLRRQLQVIHHNHLHLAQLASAFLTPSTG
jgi:hypothetical protein